MQRSVLTEQSAETLCDKDKQGWKKSPPQCRGNGGTAQKLLQEQQRTEKIVEDAQASFITEAKQHQSCQPPAKIKMSKGLCGKPNTIIVQLYCGSLCLAK
jgi:hypothetical protein